MGIYSKSTFIDKVLIFRGFVPISQARRTVPAMADQWRVYREEGVVGPLSAREIREGLRKGTIDPFDLVSRDGSKIRVELVEVDEIFAIDASDEAASNSPIAAALQRAPKEADPPVSGIPYYRPRPAPAGDEPAEEPKDGDSGRGKNDKKFKLIDKRKGELGPLAPSEIQSLFFRGILDRSVKVQKVGSDRSVPIQQFIAAYAGQRLNELANERTGVKQEAKRANAAGLPKASVSQELSRGMMSRQVASRNYLPLLSLAGVGVLAGIFFAAFKGCQRPELPDKPRAQEVEPRRETIRPRLTKRPPVLTRRDSVASKTDAVKQRADARALERATALREAQEAREASAEKRRADAQEKAAADATAKAEHDQRRIDKRARVVERERERERSKAKKAPEVRRTAKASTRPPVPPAPIAAPKALTRPQNPPPSRPVGAAPVDQIASKVGDVATLSNMAFSKEALAACALKCKLTFTDPGGRKVTGVFFKGVYQDKLTSMGGRARIIGNLKQEGGDYVMYLNGVE